MSLPDVVLFASHSSDFFKRFFLDRYSSCLFLRDSYEDMITGRGRLLPLLDREDPDDFSCLDIEKYLYAQTGVIDFTMIWIGWAYIGMDG